MDGMLVRLLRPTAVSGKGGERRSLEMLLGGGEAGGVRVSEEGALRLAAVYASVRVLAETVAQLPLFVYEREGRGKRRAGEHPLYRLLHDAPNPLMTAFEWREAMQGHLCLWGNAYSEIEWSSGGQVVALWPLRPDKMEPPARRGDELLYSYELPDGRRVPLPGWRVLHLRGLSSDGVQGYSVIADHMRQVVGMGLAVREFGSRFFRNGARPGGVLQHPGVMGDDAYRQLRESWEETYGGLSNSHRVAILEEGMTYQQVGVPPDEAQFLESMKLNRTEIAAMFRVPPHMVGDLERATFSNIEQQGIEFKVYTMEPWLVRWQQALQQRLMGEGERERYFVEFLTDALLRGDTVSRYQAHSIGRQNGWLSANDIREMENMNPVAGGDVYLVPLNMVPAGGDEAGVGQEDSGAGGQSDVEEGRGARPGEVRASQRGAARKRHQLQVDYLPVLEDVTRRIVRRETQDIGAAARKWLGRGDRDGFEAWVEAFWEEHEAWVRRQYEPVMGSYAALVGGLAAEELGKEEAPAVDGFLGAYLDAAASRHVGRARARLGKKLRAEARAEGDATAEGAEEVDEETVLEQVLEMLGLWQEREPERVAREESVRLSNAIALAIYRLLLVSRKLWLSFGDNCPYCDSLNGRSVGIDVPFLQAGGSLLPPGIAAALTVGVDTHHAPAHEGCDCMIVAG